MNDAVPEPVASVLDEAFPGRTVEDLGPAGVSWNEANETVRVWFADGGAAYLKVAVDGDGSRVRGELAAIAYVRPRCDLAVPRILAADPGGDVPYLVTEPMGGSNLAAAREDWSAEERARILRRVGAAMADVHDRSFERQGRIVGGGADGLELDREPWTDVLVDAIGAKRERASSDRFEEYFEEVVDAVRANRDALDGAPAALVHGDPAHPNLFVDGERVGAVDWELAHVGDPARELRRAESQLLYHDERFADAFREGYADRAGSLPEGHDRRVAVYDAVWHVGKLGAFDRYVEWRDDSPEAVADALRTEMDRYLDAIR